MADPKEYYAVCDYFIEHIGIHRQQLNRISELERKLEIARGALKWYADSAMYAGKCDDYQDPNCPIWSETDNDRGARARKALEEIK